MSDMNVGSVTSSYAVYSSTANQVKEDEKSKAVKQEEQPGAVYDKSAENTKKATYTINKMSTEDRAALVQQLKKDQETRKSQLASLVQQMLSKQGEVANLSSFFSKENLAKVSAAEIAQAKADIAEDGYWGIKQTSKRLFDFAAALAGDDIEKMKEMQAAMEKGFEQAKKAWGDELPEICSQTIEAANQLFEAYYNANMAE